jgi:hypothetical protein
MPKPKTVYLDCGMVSDALNALNGGRSVSFMCRPYSTWIIVREWACDCTRLARIKGRGPWTEDRLKAAIRRALAKKKGGAK